MRISKLLAITMAAAITVGGLLSIPARADDSGVGPRPGRRAQFLARVREQLQLTDDQTAKIKTVLKDEKSNITDLLTSLHDAHINLRSVIQKSGATENEIRAASAKVAAVESDLAVERAKIFGKISPILTDEQLDKLDEFQQRVDDFLDNAIKTIGERLTE